MFSLMGSSIESIGHVYRKIKFKDALTVCPSKFCNYPFGILDGYLFRKPIKANRFSKI